MRREVEGYQEQGGRPSSGGKGMTGERRGSEAAGQPMVDVTYNGTSVVQAVEKKKG